MPWVGLPKKGDQLLGGVGLDFDHRCIGEARGWRGCGSDGAN